MRLLSPLFFVHPLQQLGGGGLPAPRDQSFIISLLLLVDPEETDIERRAMETSL